MEPHQQAMNKAKIQLMSRPDSVFFTTVCFSLKHIWDNTIPTACTNGKEIRFNPEFFMKQTPEQRVFLLLHESMHVAYLHMERLQTRNGPKWNVAADHVINLMLIEREFKMPKGGLADKRYSGMSTEEVYKLLPEQDPKTVDMDLRPSEETDEVLQKEIQEILVRASIQSKMQGDSIGSIPGEIQIFLDRLLSPKLPWDRILKRYLQSLSKSDYTFRKPNRRHFPKYHLPSLYNHSLRNIAVAVDTSGSVSTEEFTQFISEVHNIMKMMKPDKLTLVQFDTEIKSVHPVKSVKDLAKVTFSGRGGTYIPCVYAWATENKPQLLLVFTDGYFRFPSIQPKVETLWLIHNNPEFTAPHGKVIHYEV